MAELRTKKGTKVTKAFLDELVAEAEAGIDLSKAKRRYVGRPSLGKGESPRISYRVPPALFAGAKKRAKAEGRTVSEIAREALQNYVAS